MTKIYLLISFLIIYNLDGFSQLDHNSECVLVELNSLDGVIFGKECAIPFEGTSNRFDIDLNHVLQAEQELLLQINNVLETDKRVQSGYQIKNTSKYFKKYKRQYFGYIEEVSNDKIIFINLLDFSGIGRPKKFKNWKSAFIFGFGEFYEKKLSHYEYNYTTKELRIP